MSGAASYVLTLQLFLETHLAATVHLVLLIRVVHIQTKKEHTRSFDRIYFYS